MVIPQNIFLYYGTNQISLFSIILRNAFLAPRVNQILNKCLNGSLSRLCNLYFRLHKKWCLQKCYSVKKWMMLIIIDKSVFTNMTLTNNKGRGYSIDFPRVSRYCTWVFFPKIITAIQISGRKRFLVLSTTKNWKRHLSGKLIKKSQVSHASENKPKITESILISFI